MSLTISKKERRKIMKTRQISNDDGTMTIVNINYYYTATSKCTPMSLGNQKSWCYFNNAPPKININS